MHIAKQENLYILFSNDTQIPTPTPTKIGLCHWFCYATIRLNSVTKMNSEVQLWLWLLALLKLVALLQADPWDTPDCG